MNYTKIYYKYASEVMSMLLDAGHLASAGRLAGAFRNIGAVWDASLLKLSNKLVAIHNLLI
jgi:hypothetical protein